MLNSINDSMSSAGGSVKLQRKGADGIMLDSTQAELNLLDSQARIKTAARVLTTLNPAQKLVWATAKKSEGNARYKSGDHDGAIELYLQALAGLDFGTEPEARRRAVHELQLPVLCNLAACMLAKQEWRRAVQLCDEALAIEPTSIKAVLRRARANTELELYKQARTDIDRARALAHSAGDRAAVNDVKKALAGLARGRREHARQEGRRAELAKRMLRGVRTAGLYSDGNGGNKVSRGHDVDGTASAAASAAHTSVIAPRRSKARWHGVVLAALAAAALLLAWLAGRYGSRK